MWSRRAQRELLKKVDDLPPLEPHRYRIGVYFADGRVNFVDHNLVFPYLCRDDRTQWLG